MLTADDAFILVPADGGRVMRHRSGQYLTFALQVPGTGLLKRNYSISSGPDDRAYRILEINKNKPIEKGEVTAKKVPNSPDTP